MHANGQGMPVNPDCNHSSADWALCQIAASVMHASYIVHTLQGQVKTTLQFLSAAALFR